ncbi:MAG: hypothetical protein A3G34_14105 [Candidatus Lindowbacteria bacterium RIFCSPLOWO2_12_FULL_62_27]|nr:MAG: hypothetical protein A3I06_00510 [Candidatus Lindowbacteria bacterium RIFCSPLOWO2_02_FULL_62_12]OGH62699.1 MAG: hypothetical protein A3G34_14105 [Candidatus Lindowbacteria bacterium RIFCSPLOWO2_12_FULL_62_27]
MTAVLDFLLVWSILVIVRLLPIRFRLLPGHIGHLALNTEVWLRRRAAGNNGRREFYVLFGIQPANRQILTMVGRRMPVWEGRWPTRILQALMRLDPKICPKIPGGHGLRSWEVMDRIGPQLYFTKDEKRRGETLLKAMGIRAGGAFVCFFARDSAYQDAVRPFASSEGWTYNDFRNSSIENYLPAAEMLADQGIWVVRMGAVVQKSIQSRHPKVIDYATGYRSDFGDVYLMAHCKFFLGDTSGTFTLASIFDVPCALANFAPLHAHGVLGRRDLFIPKKYRHAAQDRFMRFSEILAVEADDWHPAGRYRAAGISVVENSSDEVLELAAEMNARLDGRWVAGGEDGTLQDCYRALFSPGQPVSGFTSRVGAGFLRQNKALLA